MNMKEKLCGQALKVLTCAMPDPIRPLPTTVIVLIGAELDPLALNSRLDPAKAAPDWRASILAPPRLAADNIVSIIIISVYSPHVHESKVVIG